MRANPARAMKFLVFTCWVPRSCSAAEPGTRPVWSVMPDGTIIVRAKTKSVRELAGIVKLPKGKRVAIEDMNPWRR